MHLVCFSSRDEISYSSRDEMHPTLCITFCLDNLLYLLQ